MQKKKEDIIQQHCCKITEKNICRREEEAQQEAEIRAYLARTATINIEEEEPIPEIE